MSDVLSEVLNDLSRDPGTNDLLKRVREAMKSLEQYGGIDGAHHKDWVLDQIARAILADRYDDWVTELKAGEDGPDTYDYHVGIAP